MPPPVNADFEGRAYPPSDPFLITPEQIAAFAAAVGAQHPSHTDQEVAQEHGHVDVVAPPTFAVALAQQCDAQFVQDPEAGIDFSRVVHGEQAFEHHRPITAGDALVGVLHVDRVRQAGGHAMVTTRTELSTIEGERVCTATSTLVVRGES